MRYNVLVHKDPGSAFGVIVPDVPGCFSAGDTLEEALRNTAEAILFHLNGEPLPPARDIDAIRSDPGLSDDLIDATLASVSVIDDEYVAIGHGLIELVDQQATASGVSRAEFVEQALRQALTQA